MVHLLGAPHGYAAKSDSEFIKRVIALEGMIKGAHKREKRLIHLIKQRWFYGKSLAPTLQS